MRKKEIWSVVECAIPPSHLLPPGIRTLAECMNYQKFLSIASSGHKTRREAETKKQHLEKYARRKIAHLRKLKIWKGEESIFWLQKEKS